MMSKLKEMSFLSSNCYRQFFTQNDELFIFFRQETFFIAYYNHVEDFLLFCVSGTLKFSSVF
jgi:hypothetical protein